MSRYTSWALVLGGSPKSVEATVSSSKPEPEQCGRQVTQARQPRPLHGIRYHWEGLFNLAMQASRRNGRCPSPRKRTARLKAWALKSLRSRNSQPTISIDFCHISLRSLPSERSFAAELGSGAFFGIFVRD
ncbi:unnamed protein product [Symbiodinium natans]|uniref:Uncharacterized protein n=1 Tax=Symbiodinium natans TaxID=878477 RepID=A0A812KSW7_9DINO|nr:unnamed protein product [Symbiodinium natans]